MAYIVKNNKIQFPLLEGGIRALGPADDLRDERCALLDPIEADDAKLIGFTDDGLAVPEASHDLETDEHERAETAIDLYHLNHGRLRGQRTQFATIVASKIAQAEEQFRVCRMRRQGQIFPAVNDAKERFKQLRDELRELMQECREYSALAVAILVAAQCPERPWVRRLLG